MKKFFEEPVIEVEKFVVETIMVKDDMLESTPDWTEEM